MDKFDSKLFHIFPRISSICTCRNVWLCVLWANFFLLRCLNQYIFFILINEHKIHTSSEKFVFGWLIYAVLIPWISSYKSHKRCSIFWRKLFLWTWRNHFKDWVIREKILAQSKSLVYFQTSALNCSWRAYKRLTTKWYIDYGLAGKKSDLSYPIIIIQFNKIQL